MFRAFSPLALGGRNNPLLWRNAPKLSVASVPLPGSFQDTSFWPPPRSFLGVPCLRWTHLKNQQVRRILAFILTARNGSVWSHAASLTKRRCPCPAWGCRGCRRLPWSPSPGRATMGPWLKPPTRKPLLLPPRARQNWRPSPPRFFIAYASSAITCFALLPISLMPNSARPVTRA